jgi:pyruvate kinase
LKGVCASAVAAAEEIGASAIACLTHTGRTARAIARYRPAVPILALTDDPPVIRQMALVWGVVPIPVGRIDSTERIFAVAGEMVERAGYGEKVVLTAGIPTERGGPTNTVHVLEI